MKKFDVYYAHEEKIKIGGVSFVHAHLNEKGQVIRVNNKWNKIGNRYLANCSWCGSRVEVCND